ncbi:MAG: BPSS1780 family membrane protein [Gammaproteobacteria bacterium]
MPTSSAPVAVARSVPAGRGWQWIVEVWTLTAGYRPLFVGLVVAFMAFAIVASIIPVIGSIIIGLVTPVLQAGLILGCDALHRGEPLKIDHLFAGFERHTGRLVMLGGVSVIAGLAMLIVGAVIVGPSALGPLLSGIPPAPDQMVDIFVRMLLAALVVIALSLPFYMAVWFAVPLIALRGVEVGAAMSASFTACLTNTLPFLVWSLAVLGLAIVPCVPFFIAVALHLPVMLLLASTLPMMLAGVALAALFFASLYTSYIDVFAVNVGSPHG